MPVDPHEDKIVTEFEEKIQEIQNNIDKVQNQKNFPYVYIVVAVPTTIIFILLNIFSGGLIDFTASITGSLFFSLLITCAYLVLFQPNKEETLRQLYRQMKTLEREKAKMSAGLKGEKEVAYTLGWLPDTYIVLNNIVIPSSKYDKQQIDHLVIGPSGIFHLETKSINGMIVISEEGEWTVVKATQNRLVREGMDSPRLQIMRHELVLRDLLAKYFPNRQIPLTSLVVMAHPRTIIEGHEPEVNVVKKDRLIDFILQHKNNVLTDKEVRRAALAVAKAAVEQDVV